MKTTFSDYTLQHQNPVETKAIRSVTNTEGYILFEVLSKIDNIIKMIAASERGEPALGACVEEIEDVMDALDIGNGYRTPGSDEHKAIGKMVKSILLPYGYEKIVQNGKEITKDISGRYFKIAQCYENNRRG